ncbi:hypothetical protein L1987_70044 [Smallanthus sonchifolius]|uniref:Uncharacterized protein n=1 Tax=Smallanthus sonchifolius TaxID=185202 RepID=A0ACB9APT7_9ASTR|nr:hypothetical protein L1987_70044 [Smallanthus sonchifolius]
MPQGNRSMGNKPQGSSVQQHQQQSRTVTSGPKRDNPGPSGFVYERNIVNRNPRYDIPEDSGIQKDRMVEPEKGNPTDASNQSNSEDMEEVESEVDGTAEMMRNDNPIDLHNGGFQGIEAGEGTRHKLTDIIWSAAPISESN